MRAADLIALLSELTSDTIVTVYVEEQAANAVIIGLEDETTFDEKKTGRVVLVPEPEK